MDFLIHLRMMPIMNEAILEELKHVQVNYLLLLKELNERSKNDISGDVIDRVNVFWYKNRNIIKLAFEYLFKDKDTYSFSGATIFNVDDRDQNGFFLLGDYHIFDDPIPSYLNTLTTVSDDVYLSKIKEIVSNTIVDNIRIIEELSDYLIILPLRYISVVLNQHYKDLDDLATNLFCCFFKDINNLDDFKIKINSIEELVDHFEPDISSSLILYDDDNPNLTWDYRIKKYREENNNINTDSYSDRDLFFFGVFGYIRQAFALIDMTNTFGVIPFVRNFISLHYFLFVSSIINNNAELGKKIPHLQRICLKSEVSYFLFREYWKRHLKLPLHELVKKAKDVDIESKLFSNLKDSIDQQEILPLIKVINNCLDNI